ncbi:hypothetical protein Tco_1134648 [Tanacetum coccineum]
MLRGRPPIKASKSFSLFGTMFGHKVVNSSNLLFIGFKFNFIYTSDFQVVRLACSIPIGWAYAFHQDKASSVKVPVANITLFSSTHLLRENTDSFPGFSESSSKITSTYHGSSLCFQGCSKISSQLPDGIQIMAGVLDVDVLLGGILSKKDKHVN